MIFLKLGGSLITDKRRPETARRDVLSRLAQEIASAWPAVREEGLLVGHGSGSFGHVAAARYSTHQGASSPEDWRGFAEVWRAANRLHRMMVDALAEAGLPVMSFPPSASALAEAGEIASLADEPIRRALANGLLPVVAGDVAFDRARGTCIISTERVFLYLAPRLRPSRVLLAGVDPGVYADFPRATRVQPSLTEADLSSGSLAGSQATDVTGGMAEKVELALAMVRSVPGLEARIFSGDEPGAVEHALRGAALGTLIFSTR
jgi:isopentenyl phosphate kinase